MNEDLIRYRQDKSRETLEDSLYSFSSRQVVLGVESHILRGVLGLYAEGWTEDQILENYPNLMKESLLAVFAYTHECMREEFLYPLHIERA